MEVDRLLSALIAYLGFIPLLTFHEFGHAWVALKCGDDTARLQGRVSLNPVVHMELVGTVILPLAAIFLSMANSPLAGLIIGWGKPVPVNLYNLRHPRRDDTLVALAGPAMNVLLAIGLVGLAKIGTLAGSELMVTLCTMLTLQSLFLCFFNLLPVPPLDGSHVLKNLIGMSYETYFHLCRYGLIAVIIVMQIPAVPALIRSVTFGTYRAMRMAFDV